MPAITLPRIGGSSSHWTAEIGQFISTQIRSPLAHLRQSFVLSKNAIGAENELHQVFQDCNQPNWDGYGAMPVSEDSHQLALKFLIALPLGMPIPSVGAEPDGQITLEWYRSARRTLSISISPQNELHFAALIGVSKRYGTEPFYGEISKHLLDLIRDVMVS